VVAEDIVQGAYLKFYLLDDPESIDNPFGYLLTICKNIHRDKIKSSKVRDLYTQYLKYVEDKINEHSPERLLIIDEEYKSTIELIDRLPPRCKRVFVMRIVYGMSHKEIAAYLGITKHAVEKHIRRSRDRIRDML